MKLSERLQSRLDIIEDSVKSFGLSTNNLCPDHEWFILSECLELVRKVEDAPRYGISRYFSYDLGRDKGQVIGELLPCLLGKRVAIIPIEEDTP
jgi:hypothetical protein